MGITWLRSEICPILLIATALKALKGSLKECQQVVALVWSDCYVTSIHLGRRNMYDMQLVLSYMVTRCNGVPSL